MLKVHSWISVVVLALFASSAHAQSFSWNLGDSRSAFRDVSNLEFGSLNYYDVRMRSSAADPSFYINQFNLTSGANWDPLLNRNLYVPDTNLYHGNEQYTLGTQISGDNNWQFQGVTWTAAANALVADGTYHSTLNILGGATSASLDTLASLDFNLQVRQKLDVSVSTSASPDTIVPGEATQLSMTVTNNMTGQDFVSTSWFVSGFADGLGNFLDNTGFSYNPGWFDQHIAPGDSLTNPHSTWAAGPNQALGTYFGRNGVVGGLYNGDEYQLVSSPQGTITVSQPFAVPEPSVWATMCLGATLIAPLLRRRRG